MLTFHTLLGIVALIAGAWNLTAKKGTRRHRAVGWVYVVSMVGLLLTSFTIFELFGGFGPFHAMSLVSGGTLALAIYFPLRRSQHDGWLEHHYFWISFSYVGLVMATGSHFALYWPEGWPLWARNSLWWGLPLAIGFALIFGQRDKVIDRVKNRGSVPGAV